MDQGRPGAETEEARGEAVRRFNRFYTRQIGVLQEGLLESPFSLTEARVLYELAHREAATAAPLARELGLDAGYLSRLLRSLERRALVARERSPRDGRQSLLLLTDRGQEAFADLDRRSRADVQGLLGRLPAAEQHRLLEAMRTIEDLLQPKAERSAFVLRAPEPGDLGRVVALHGRLYAQEFGWDQTFEALVAAIVARFGERNDPGRERLFVAETGGELVGCVLLVKKTARVAQLRILLVDPRARGQGLGARLVQECLRFARAARYARVVLWTNDVLGAARRLYERAGFRRTGRKRHRSFGRSLTGETWALDL